MKTLHLSIVIISLLIVFSLSGVANANPDFKSEKISDPVLFMKTNSTGKIVMLWTPFFPSNGTFDVIKEIYGIDSNPFPIKSSDLIITSNPTSINLNRSSTIVTYTITAKNNVNGIYEIPLHYCGYSPPLIIGLNDSDVNPLIFYNYFGRVYSCPAVSETYSEQTVVNYTGIVSKDITVDISKISPLKQYGKAHAIICKYGLVSLKKLSDNTPACVKPETSEKLIQRGWGLPYQY